jgi:hypothetical protein
MTKTRVYSPPFTITPAIVNLVADIAEALGRLSLLTDTGTDLRLRRVNRIRTIRARWPSRVIP